MSGQSGNVKKVGRFVVTSLEPVVKDQAKTPGPYGTVSVPSWWDIHMPCDCLSSFAIIGLLVSLVFVLLFLLIFSVFLFLHK